MSAQQGPAMPNRRHSSEVSGSGRARHQARPDTSSASACIAGALALGAALNTRTNPLLTFTGHPFQRAALSASQQVGAKALRPRALKAIVEQQGGEILWPAGF